MSNLGPFGGGGGRGAQMIPTPPRGDTIARYPTYLEAQRAVDHLSDNGFPVQFVTIVGTGLRMVERVTGRLTYSIVAVRSLISGAYFGALVGLFLNLFTNANGTIIIAGALFGAGFSVIFGLIAYSLTGGRRDFSSVSQVVATEYEVLCMPEQAGRARELLSQLPNAGRTGPTGVGAGTPGGTGPYGPPPMPPPPYQPPSPPQQPHYSPEERSERAAAGPGQPGPGELPEQPPVSGPTYSEMIERQRRERAEREAAEREAGQREPGQREPGQQEPGQREPGVQEPGQREPGAQEPGRREPGDGSRGGGATRAD